MSSQAAQKPKLHVWLRAESKKVLDIISLDILDKLNRWVTGERRTPLMPSEAEALIHAGHWVSVEESDQRCVKDEEYEKVGCQMVPSGSWKVAPPNAIILGLKALPEEDTALHHQHLFFAHVFKQQVGWKQLLSRFLRGNGVLFDMEYLTDDNGRRVAAFGQPAGYVGMAVGLLTWAHQKLNNQTEKDNSTLPPLNYYSEYKQLLEVTRDALSKALAVTQRKPKIVVIGPAGRCGTGAINFAREIGLEEQVSKWDINITMGRGPFPELLEHDIVINCIYLLEPIPPFLTMDLINNTPNEKRTLSVVVDVSCDTFMPHNPLPIYSDITTIDSPTTRIVQAPNPLDVVAIDHLPTIVALETSRDFSKSFINHLINFGASNMWNRCKNIYFTKSEPLRDDMKHVWLRDELADNDRRTPLTPQDAKRLIDAGFRITVERSTKRVFTDEEYESLGCTLVEAGTWKEAPPTATILGLQSLGNEDQTPLKHQHMFFGYAFKEQAGWKELLSRFVEGGGSLIDLEYLTDDNGRRVTSFSQIAGYIGMAAGILVWCHQQLNAQKGTRVSRSNSREGLDKLASADEIDKSIPMLQYVQSQLQKAASIAGHPPVPVVIGAKGAVGSGAVAFAEKLGLTVAKFTREDTKVGEKNGDGVPALLEYDILINAIKLSGPTAPFLTQELIHRAERELNVIVDISCDVFSPNNPLPIYKSPTVFARPTQRVVDDPSNPLDLIAIQNLAALLPRESSYAFSSQLLPHLLHLADKKYDVRDRALSVFKEKTKGIQVATTSAPALQLPTDFSRSDDPAVRKLARVSMDVPSDLLSQLQSTATKLNTNTTNLFCGIFQVLLHRLTLEEDIALGVLRLASNAFGTLFTLRSDVNGTTPFAEFQRKVNAGIRKQELTAMRLSPTEMQQHFALNPPTFQAFFATLPQQHIDTIADLALLFDVTLAVSEDTSTTLLTLLYRSDLFEEERMKETLSQLEYLFKQITQNSEENIQKYSLLTPTARKHLPDVKEPLDATWIGSIHEHFHKNALKNPDKIAAVHKTDTLTYKELDQWTSKLANHLINEGLKPEETVFIYGSRNLSMVWAVMGILKAGGSVSLMDPAYPPERIINCLKVAQPKAWISIEAAGEMHKEVSDFLPTVGCTIRVVLPLPKDAEQRGFLKDCSAEFPNIPITKDSIAVVTFTSGSTGLPKGVLGRHGPLTHIYPWMKERFGLSENDHTSMCSGISHDPLQRDIFTPLFFGATIHVPDAEDIGNPGQLAEWMKAHKITNTHLTPAMGQLLSETTKDIQVDTLRVALLVGDKLTKRDVHRLRKVAPKVMCVNMYGSTETQRSVSYYEVPSNEKLERMKEILPVGVGMKDVQLIILNNDNQQTGVGEIGEIYVRSPHLARGYKGLEEQTKAKFIQNPFSTDPEDRLYRTGDLGRYRVDGIAEVVGRLDNQVKIRGFRIELGEINTMLSFHPAVKENIPIVREDTPGDKRIVAYVIPHRGQLVPPGHQLRKFLESKLPHYMIPSAFVVLKSMPLTPNGKINIAALPAPERMQTNRLDKSEPVLSDTIVLNEKSFAGFWKEMFPDMILESPEEEKPAFTTESEQKLAALWSELLGTSNFTRDDNFFDLGGHSLMATRMIFKLRQALNLELPLDILLKNPTVSSLSSAIESFKSNPSQTAPQSGVNLLKEVVLDAAIQLPSNAQLPSEKKNVLLTGATGFLGVFILRELLERTDATVHCLVRASTRIDGKQRLNQTLKIHRIWKDSYENRIIPVPGDLGKPLLGIQPDEFQQLAETIDCIIHSAALVHWIYPYEQVKAQNVLGTQEIIRLAATTRIKSVHHISTTSVFDSAEHSDLNKTVYEDDPLENPAGLTGGYPQSKWVAEKLVMEARKRGIPANIYRPGYISGDSTNGVWTTDDFLCRVIKGCIQMNSFPNLEGGKLDICTVDYVSRTVVHISQKTDILNKSFNLSSNSLFDFKNFFETAKKFGYEVQERKYSDWKATLEDLHLKNVENALHPVISVFSDDWPKNLAHPPYDLTNTFAAIQNTDITCKPIDPLLEQYFSYFIRSGFLPVPQNKTELHDKWLSGEAMDLVTRTNRSRN